MEVGVALAQLLVMGLIFAIMLRAAVWLYNRMFGKKVASPFRPADEAAPMTFENYDVVESGPYAPPATYVSEGQAMVEVVGVPVPSFGKAIVVCIASLMAQGGLQLLTSLVVPLSGSIALGFSLAGNVIGFAALAGMLKLMLPTTLGRGLAVAGIFYLILIGIAVTIAMLLRLIWFLSAR